VSRREEGGKGGVSRRERRDVGSRRVEKRMGRGGEERGRGGGFRVGEGVEM